MKKIICLFVTMLMCLCLVGCGNNSTSEATTWSEQLKTKGKIVVGISPDFPPFESLTTDGTIEGFDVDVINELITYLDEEVVIEFAQIEFDNIVTAVQTGQVDIGLSGFTYDPNRDVIFSTPYVESGQAVMVTKNSGVTSIEDLKGKTVGGQTGTTGYEAAEAIEGIKEAVSFTDCMVGFASVGSTIDAFVTDYGVVKKYADANDMTVLDGLLVSEEMSIIVKNGNNLLADKLNECIDQFLKSDKYEELRIKWGV
ncbi:MAG: transporter substrate-binding domain-containing protein [Erysipelotrichaceae bacterium]|nr:transporter substrate-binding domain-containing protein [Erysipelotrichaceae bacterium]